MSRPSTSRTVLDSSLSLSSSSTSAASKSTDVIAAIPASDCTPASPKPRHPPPVHTLDTRIHNDAVVYYNNYSPAFTEITAYDNSNNSDISNPSGHTNKTNHTNNILANRPAALSSLSRANSTRHLEAFGSKFLTALTESVQSPAGATALSRTRSLHQRARSFASFVPSLAVANPVRRPATAHIDEEEEPVEQDDDRSYDNPIMEYKSTLTGGHRTPTSSRPSAPQSDTARPGLAQTSFRKWFGGSKQVKPEQPPTLSPSTNSDLLQPATSLLLPHGSLGPEDPASFSELLKNADALITRLQAAYRHQEDQLKIARQEREAATEEAEEADTRARHLKLQLDDMCRKADDQHMACSAMAEELATEKLRRVQDAERFQKEAASGREGKRRSFRNSGASLTSMSSIASDSGFESDCYPDTETEAMADSIASRPRTPLGEQQRWDSSTKNAARPISRGSLQNRTCQVDAGVWSWMREEKGRLERRVKELEGAIDGCLDMVSRV